MHETLVFCINSCREKTNCKVSSENFFDMNEEYSELVAVGYLWGPLDPLTGLVLHDSFLFTPPPLYLNPKPINIKHK